MISSFASIGFDLTTRKRKLVLFQAIKIVPTVNLACLPTLAVCPSIVDTLFCAPASQIWTRPLWVPTATRPLCKLTNKLINKQNHHSVTYKFLSFGWISLVSRFFIPSSLIFFLTLIVTIHKEKKNPRGWKLVAQHTTWFDKNQSWFYTLPFLTKTQMSQSPHQMQDHRVW